MDIFKVTLFLEGHKNDIKETSKITSRRTLEEHLAIHFFFLFHKKWLLIIIVN
jgi:hypothetical protein